jgi:hypothetical protein
MPRLVLLKWLAPHKLSSVAARQQRRSKTKQQRCTRPLKIKEGVLTPQIKHTQAAHPKRRAQIKKKRKTEGDKRDVAAEGANNKQRAFSGEGEHS